MNNKDKNLELEKILQQYSGKEKTVKNNIEKEIILEKIEKVEKIVIPDKKSPHDREQERNRKEERIQKVRRRRKTKVNFIIVIIILLITAVTVFIGFKIFSDITGFGKPDKEITITINQGSGAYQISKILADSGVINSEQIFRLYVKRSEDGANLQFGEFTLNSNMDYDTIIHTLKTPSEREDIITVNFYEGMTQRDIGERLEEKGVCTEEEFRDALENSNYDYEFLNSIPPSRDKFNKYEGYLFPDTYTFYIGENPESIVKRFFDNFEKRITPEILADIQAKGMTLDEVMTMASIVQAEAGDPVNMYPVAGVFMNRMDSKEMKRLESDVTIFYVRDEIQPYLVGSDKEVETQMDRWYDVYNTYVVDGLPAGPVGNPGLDAVDAVLNPEEHDYYYFVTDISGKYYYGNTAPQHYANVAEAGRVNDNIKKEQGQ